MNTTPNTPQLLDLAGIAELVRHQVEARGVVQTMALGGGIGTLLVREGEHGRAWTLEAAAEHHGLELPDALACFALWRGCYESWAVHAADVWQAELDGSQLVLEGD